MTPRTILLYLDEASNVERLVRLGARVATRGDVLTSAVLVGTHASPSLPLHGGMIDAGANRVVLDHADAQRAVTERIRTRFLDAAARHELDGRWETLTVDTLGENAALRERARGADLVVLPQPPEDSTSRFVEVALRDIVTEAGRPVLVIPRVGDFADVGRHLLIGWSPTREATRAVHDALALARPGAHATLLWVSRGRGEHPELERSARVMADALERHGLGCSVTHWRDADIPVGDVLLNESFERAADLIVCGAHGHSRLHDLVLGTTTRHLLEHMTLPVLFAH